MENAVGDAVYRLSHRFTASFMRKWGNYMDKHTIYDISKDGLPKVDEDVVVYDHGRWYVASFTGRYAEISKRDNAGNYLIVPIWDDGEGVLGMFSSPPMPTHYIKLPKFVPDSDAIVHVQNVPRRKVTICHREEIIPTEVISHEGK